jgi:hypothetical protein
MRTIKKSTPTDDSVNRSYVKAVSTEQNREVVKFLPIFESIKPEDFERVVKSPELAEDGLEVGRFEYAPAAFGAHLQPELYPSSRREPRLPLFRFQLKAGQFLSGSQSLISQVHFF